MENYLIDKEALSQFIDELMKEKALPANNAEELYKLREESIKALDDKIGKAILGSMSEEQGEEFRQLLDNDNGSSDTYDDFFKRNNINIEEIISQAMQEFSTEFIGGNHA